MKQHEQLMLGNRLTDTFGQSTVYQVEYVDQIVNCAAAAAACQNNYPQLFATNSCLTSAIGTENVTKSASAAVAAAIANSQQTQLPPMTRIAVDYLQAPLQTLDDKINYYVTDIWVKHADERSSKLPFMSAGPWKLICATIIYLYLIKYALPRAMRTVKPFELNWIIRIYNLLMVLSNIYAFYHGCRIFNFGLSTFGCEVINHSDASHEAIELLYYGWFFFLSRIVEWLDTFFFVLRKKDKQVTKLHVFHHSFVPILVWFYLKFHPGRTVGFFPFVNTFVHTIMYTYYLLASFGPKIQPYLWWKKYLTSLQIAQFVLIIFQLATIYMSTNEKCQYPKTFLYVAIAGAILFLWLFYSYYVDTYSKRPFRKSSSSAIKITSQKMTNGREGHSTSLSDCVDNAIVTPDEDDNCQKKRL